MDWRWRSRLGDLAGEMALEEVTRLLSDFADRAIDQAVRRRDRGARSGRRRRRASR